MKILLLGGTGAMGAYLSEILSARGDEVYVTTRSDRVDDQICYIKGNAHDNDFVLKLLQNNYDIVVDFMVYKTDEFRQRVSMMLESTSQYLYFSSSRVYAESDRPITEHSPRLLDVCKDKDYLETDEYALTKARQENMLFESAKNNWTIIRPYITYSNARLQLGTMEKENWLFRAIHGKHIIFPKDVAAHRTTMTYGFDVARAIVSLIGNSDAYGKAVHITGTDTKKWNDVLNIYLDTIETKFGKRPQVTMLENSNTLMKRMNNTYQVRYDRLYDRVFDNSLANQLCGPIDYMSMETGLKKCMLEFLEQNQNFIFTSWRYEGWADRQASDFEPLRNIPGWKNKCKYILTRYGLQ